MNGSNGDGEPDARPIEAVRALRARGIDNAEEMLAHGTPEQILSACYRWDARHGVGPGLLAQWIRTHQFIEPPTDDEPRSKTTQLRARFDDYARRFPEGETVEPHAALIARRYPDELDAETCAGEMVVLEATYPLLTLCCDECGYVVALGPRSLHILGPGTTVTRPTFDQPF